MMRRFFLILSLIASEGSAVAEEVVAGLSQDRVAITASLGR